MKLVLLFIAIHILLAVFLGATLNVWADESCSLVTTGGDLAFALKQAVHFEWQPPGYFVVLWFWRQVHDSVLWARTLSMVCSSLAILTFYLLSRRIAGQQAIWPYWATLVTAFHPYTLFAAVELRLYAMALLLSLVQFYLFWRCYLENEKGLRWWYLAIAIFSLHVNSLLGITLLSQNLVLWTSRKWNAARIHASSLAIAGLVYIPMFLLQLQSLKEGDFSADDQSLSQIVLFVLGSLPYSVMPLPRIDATLTVRIGLAVVLGIAALWTILANRRQLDAKQLQIWSYLGAISAILTLFLVTTKLPLHPRYTYSIVVASLLAWGQLTALIRRPAMVVSVWMISLIICIGTLVFTYQPLCKTGDWIRVSRYLESHEEAKQPIIVFVSEVDTILRNHYHGANAIVPVPSPQRMDRFRYADFDIPSESSLRERLDPLLENANTCWLVTDEEAINDVPYRYHQEYLYAYLNKDFVLVETKEFVDSKVSRWQRK